MAENSKIEWTDHTWNPWWGCTKVSLGCANCYAEGTARRFGVEWGKGAPRRKASTKVMNDPLRWNEAAKREGVRRRVFVASMADWCDPEAPDEWRSEMWEVIANCTHLDWLMLTKRPERLTHCLPLGWTNEQERWRHVWLGTTVENQEMANKRIPLLLQTPAAVRFLSCEPLLGPVDLSEITRQIKLGEHVFSALECDVDPEDDEEFHGRSINWVIAGGESGPGARPCAIEWVRSIVQQCKVAGVPAFVKQMGSKATEAGKWFAPTFADRKGGDINEFPEDLKVREFPCLAQEGSR